MSKPGNLKRRNETASLPPTVSPLAEPPRCDKVVSVCRAIGWHFFAVWAGVAQLVEHLICNQAVGGSNPFASSSFNPTREEF